MAGTGEQQARDVDEHLRRALALVAPLPVRVVPVADALGAVVAEDVHAAVPVPPFDGAAMDGYAVRLADLPPDGAPVTLPVAGDVAAGPGRTPALAPGHAVRIMTGAPLPAGADAVVPVEHTSTGRFVAGAPRTEEAVTLARRPRTHVRAAGEDVGRGDLLARPGTVVTPALVGALVASGAVDVPVRRRPVVAVISTGAELVPAGTTLGPGQITDSNGPMLAAAATAAGADVVRLGPVPDDPAALRAALDAAVDPAEDPAATGAGRSGAGTAGARPGGVDLVVTAGGVSAGAADVVRELLAAAPPGLTDPDVAAVALSPGRPQALARWRGVPWLALPGNPVGAYASFALFARPAIDRLRGALPQTCLPVPTPSTPSDAPGRTSLPAAAVLPGSPGRLLVVPVRLAPLPGAGHDTGPGTVGVAPAGSRHSLSALATADGLALVPPGVEKVRVGDLLEVLVLR
ncbi:molybdopterin molybdotransferase MoeA [Promicromonospora citrea]|uniref:Molybdopterin molybdenumtransferase n=1 Tax=Promicromonospora citrea TaxID=43677 RepID=A0A8H9L1V1_9MICO|nr:molybdopterin molybdotransferase MoeA [Promicromonospora citrea]NNH52917.1 molybdopterin molybdotransferase MoeA [Promicromonospora citrea]GGM09035.1 molybdopterin molybdenumtransferase [Promicromonospora citrea]